MTNVLQGVLPDGLQNLANSGAIWISAAFVAGMLIRSGRRLAPSLAGLATQVGAVVGYYGYAELFRDGMGDLWAPSVWLALGLVMEPLFGAAGAWRRPAPLAPERVGGRHRRCLRLGGSSVPVGPRQAGQRDGLPG